MNTITNISAFIGLTIIIKNAPTIQPINAPNIGISAVKAIKTPIKSAYGNRIIDSVTKNIVPKINASRHCPVIKFEKVSLLNFATYVILFTIFSGKAACINILTCL